MDTARTVFGRLSVALGVFLLGICVSFSPSVARAYSQPDALAACQVQANNWMQQFPSWSVVCQVVELNNGAFNYYAYCPIRQSDNGNLGNCASIDNYTPPPSNPCTSLAGYNGDFSYSPGQNLPLQRDMDVTDSNTGMTVTCHATMKWSGNPTMDAYRHLHVQLSLTWDANPGTNDGNASGSSAYLGADGKALTPQPVVTQGPSPQLCGGGSCYDPNAGTFSTVGPAGSASLPDSVANSSSGGCSSSGSVTMCAGSPTPPLPPAPPVSQITDPATQVQGSDTYQQQNPITGAMSGVTVTTYAAPGSKSSSGSTSTSQPANSSGPGAPASSSSSAGDGVSGGGSCTSPPACTGDAVQCAVVSQTYDTRCNVSQVHTDLAGTQSPPQSGQHQESEVDGGTTDIGSQAGNLDTGGLGYSSACPFGKVAFAVGGYDASIDLTIICEWQGWMSGLVLVLASLKCADILGGK